MTDKNERTFEDEVEILLNEVYGEDNVFRQYYYDESYRFADFYVRGPLFDMALELENDWEACIKGVGQALLYSGHKKNCIPVVVVPEGHVEQPEVDILREYLPIVEV